MEWLDALVAFSIVMMVLSTVVSAIVESILSFSNQRVKGLELLMEHMFDQIIKPRLGNSYSDDFTNSKFIKQMTDMRWLPVSKNAGLLARFRYLVLTTLRRVDKVDSLTTLEFIERLAESPVGSAIIERTRKYNDNDEKLGIFLTDLASKFEDFGENASKYFARRARMISILVGFVLVFSINFNIVHVTGTLLQSESSRNALLAEGDRIANQLKGQLASQQSAMEDDSQTVDLDTAKQQITESVEQGMQELQKAQIPYGWEHAPWHGKLQPSEDSKWIIDEWLGWIVEEPGAFFGWFLSVFLAGVLVGLGGPFWFNTFRKLSALSTLARSFKSQVKQTETDLASQAQSLPTRTQLFLDVFNTSMAANSFARTRGRRPLSKQGNPIIKGYNR